MANGRRGDVLRQFRALMEGGSVAGLSDGELLERSASRSGAAAEVAFAALVERHGPMVLRVCRKALADPHDAHDAFQSTFLVLARKADAIRNRDSVASWLHGVALRVSAASRTANARRRKHERVKAGARPLAIACEGPDDLGLAIHEEVARLPRHYREAVVLCYLEGKTYEDAAGALGLPVGTVKSRLAWARERLRGRLARRGLAPAVGAVATILAGEAANAASPLPGLWAETTAEAAMRFAAKSFATIGPGTVPGPAAALADGVIRAMILHKLKAATLAGGVLLLASGAAVMGQYGPPVPAQSAPEPRDGERLKSLESKLDRLISALEGQKTPAPAPHPSPVAAPALPPDVLPPLAPPAYPPAAAAPAIAADVAPRAARASVDRIGAIERRLAQLEGRIAALERKASASAASPFEGQATTNVTETTTATEVVPSRPAPPELPPPAAAPSPR